MDLSKHCQLCDHQLMTLKLGSICKLTDEKPNFQKTCPKITLNEKFENILKNACVEFETVKRRKTLTLIYFVVFIVISISVFILGFNLMKYTFGWGIFSTVPIVIMGVSIIPFGMAFGHLNGFRTDFKIAKNKMKEIDSILNLYNITYHINVDIKQRLYGTDVVTATLNVNYPKQNK